MKKASEFLNLKYPVIEQNNRITKSMKLNHKTSIRKNKDINIIKLHRNIDLLNHIKNISRNSNKSNTQINNNNLTFRVQERKNSFKLIPAKDINISIKNNIIGNNLFNKIENHNINNSKNSASLEKLYPDLKENFIKTPNTINTSKNKYYLSFYSKNNSNNNIKNSNFCIFKNKNIRNNSISTIIDNKKYISFNDDFTKVNNFTQNNIKMLLRDKVNKKSINQNIENQNQINFLKKGPNYNNLKFIMPKILNKSSNSKKYIICENIEDTKISKNNDKYFVSQPIMLKEIRNIENLNHINNFIMILKKHISIENELTEFIYKSQEVQSIKNKAKFIINLYNTFFNQLDYITFDINIFINKEYNLLLQKIIKLLMYYHCYIFLYVVLNDSQTSFTIIRSYYFEILKIISFCLYNLFTKFIYKELSNNKYKDLSFISSLNSLLNNNKEYIIKSTLSNNDIYSLINQNYNLGINKFIKAMNDKGNEYLEEVEISLKKLLLNLNQKDLLYHIDICLNIFLYSILEKNIEIAKKNSKKNIVSFKNKSLNLVPYLPPFSSENINKYKYTIVLDIDETLGHFIYNDIKAKYFHNYGYLILDNNNKFLFKSDKKDKIKVGLFLIRPYAKFFLEKINNLFFEIVMFSAGTKEYCDKVLDILDINNNLIKYRLYRTHLSLRNINNDVKDLSLLGRDLSKVIMIDNYSENYKLQQDNGLPIDSWTGDIYDTSLRDLIPIMNYIVENNVEDVREVIKKVKTQLNNISSNSFNYEKINLKF